MRSELALLTVGMALVTGGCASHIHTLAARPDSPFVRGEFAHVDPMRLVIETAQKRFEDTGFAVSKSTDYAGLRKKYQATNPKHWDRIVSGMDSDHAVYSAKPRVRASDGDEMRCDLSWLNGHPPAGTCTDAPGKTYAVTFD